MCYCCTLCNRCGRADEKRKQFGLRKCPQCGALVDPYAPITTCEICGGQLQPPFPPPAGSVDPIKIPE